MVCIVSSPLTWLSRCEASQGFLAYPSCLGSTEIVRLERRCDGGGAHSGPWTALCSTVETARARGGAVQLRAAEPSFEIVRPFGEPVRADLRLNLDSATRLSMPGGCGYSQGARGSDQNDPRVERDLDV